jgi:prepilin-type N-terminal cleavage/methylation domain-containing protein
MRFIESRARSHPLQAAGFTLPEALVALVLVAIAGGTLSDTLVGVLKRGYITIDVTRASDESERFAAALVQQGKAATRWAIYADRADYLRDPVGAVAVQGNVLVFEDQLGNGATITEMFEYDPANRTLVRYENNLNQLRSQLDKVVTSVGRPTIFEQDLGLVQAHWSVQSKYEQLDFEAYANPLRMR